MLIDTPNGTMWRRADGRFAACTSLVGRRGRIVLGDDQDSYREFW